MKNNDKLAELARRVLAEALLEGRKEGGAVVHGMGLSVAVVVRPHAEDLSDCGRDVLAVLNSATAPMSRSRILAELWRCGILWSESAVARAAAWMVRRGYITASRRRPRGYSVALQGGKAVTDAA